MIGRRAVIGLSLLCALVFCAFASTSASAAGTTAFTCVKEGGEKDFADSHCEEKVGAGKGSFGHAAIEPETMTETELSQTQSSVLIGEAAGANVEIVCESIAGTGTLTNKEVSKTMQSEGSATINHTKCTVTKPSGCQVVEPISYAANFKTYDNESGAGIEFTPSSGKAFGTITYTGTKCALKGKGFNIEGAFKGIPNGGTLSFDDGGTLKWGSWTYTLDGVVTLRMKGGGNPITFTTS